MRRQNKTRRFRMTVKAHVASLSEKSLTLARCVHGKEDDNGMITTHVLILDAKDYTAAETEFSRLWPRLSGLIEEVQ